MSADSKESSVRLIITGRVQGVWYRAWFMEKAINLALSGWIRNLNDGSVEAVVSGLRENVEEMKKTSWSGPPLAKVDNIDVGIYKAKIVNSGFRQLPTN